jgi:hypothetical protein
MPVKDNRKRKKPVDNDEATPYQRPSKQKASAKTRRDKIGSRSYSIKQMKLNTFCKKILKKDLVFRNAIRRAVRDINQVIMEAYGFMNFHLLRCIQKKKDLPVFDVAFFQYSNAAVMIGKGNTTNDSFLEESKELYQKEMQTEGNYVPIRARQSINHILDKLAEIQIKTMCENHLKFGFVNRLCRYLRIQLKKKQKEAKSFIYGLFNKAEELTDEEIKWKQWLQYNPYLESEIESNMAHFVKLSYQILVCMEESNEQNRLIKQCHDLKGPDETKEKYIKAVQLFTLFPKKAGFTLSHIYIDSQALFAILSEIKKENPDFLKDQFEKKDFSYQISANSTQRERVWSTLFDYKRMESKDKTKLVCFQKTFDFVMTTDGYKVCVRFLKPSNGQTKKTKKSDKKKKSAFENNNPGLNLNMLNASEFDRLIGLDPGRNYFATMFDSNNDYMQFKTSEYASRSFLYRYNIWFENFKTRNLDYKTHCEKMPSYKTSNIQSLLNAMKYAVSCCNYMFEKSFELQRWSFKLERFRMKTLHEYAKKVIFNDKKVCIGYGNMNQSNSIIKGSIKFPIESFKKVLRERGATVIIIDEYNTTKMCSECHKECDKVIASEVPREKRMDSKITKISRRGRTKKISKQRPREMSIMELEVIPFSVPEEPEEVQEKKEETTKRTSKKKKKTSSSYCEYLRCQTPNCIGNHSHRDYNSSKNHLMLLKELLRTKDPKARPKEFRRNGSMKTKEIIAAPSVRSYDSPKSQRT